MTSLPVLPILAADAFHLKLEEKAAVGRLDGLRAAPHISTLQINIGLVCNLACRHCHVASSPKRDGAGENMQAGTVDRVLEWLDHNSGEGKIQTVDITGGSPEMNPHFRRLVTGCKELGLHVMDRCNPTIITHQDSSGVDYQWIPEFLAEHQVEVTASLPCYLEGNVEQQRGRGSYSSSVEGLRRLNAVGYGRKPELRLNLVYNPTGPSLPPPQEALTCDYRRELDERFGIVFNDLFTLTNMPIARWRQDLERQDGLDNYLGLLVGAFNPATVDGLMCRHQIHIDCQGRLFDCDFNYAVALPTPEQEGRYLWQTDLDELASRRIATGDHCYGCTAGAGSSCGGVLT